MKNYFLTVLLLISVSGFTASAQKTSTDKANEPTKKNSNLESSPKAKTARRILSFAKSEEMFQILEGKWLFSETDCEKAFTVKVSSDRKTIKLIYPKSEEKPEREYVYNVLEVGKYYIRTQIEGEKRLTADGKPVVWDFMFISEDEFIWHRTDWKGLNSTSSVTRCK